MVDRGLPKPPGPRSSYPGRDLFAPGAGRPLESTRGICSTRTSGRGSCAPLAKTKPRLLGYRWCGEVAERSIAPGALAAGGPRLFGAGPAGSNPSLSAQPRSISECREDRTLQKGAGYLYTPSCREGVSSRKLGVSFSKRVTQKSYGKQRETKNSTPEIEVMTNAIRETPMHPRKQIQCFGDVGKNDQHQTSCAE